MLNNLVEQIGANGSDNEINRKKQLLEAQRWNVGFDLLIALSAAIVACQVRTKNLRGEWDIAINLPNSYSLNYHLSMRGAYVFFLAAEQYCQQSGVSMVELLMDHAEMSQPSAESLVVFGQSLVRSVDAGEFTLE